METVKNASHFIISTRRQVVAHGNVLEAVKPVVSGVHVPSANLDGHYLVVLATVVRLTADSVALQLVTDAKKDM